MRIGFDAKRALNNYTGLGNHARILLNAMMRDFNDNDYLLFSPKAKDELLNEINGDFKIFFPDSSKERAVHPMRWIWQYFGLIPLYLFFKKAGLWRSWGITADLIKEHVQVYHGISNELPFNIHKTDIKTVVTIHDLIFLKHTDQYAFFDRQVFKLKTRYAAKYAHKIIAVSHETKNDLINFYKVKPEKIEVIYPSVDAAFQSGADFGKPDRYNLPDSYILNVSSFYPRKNHLRLLEAYRQIMDKVDEHLVLVGTEGTLKKQLEAFIAEHNMSHRVTILTGVSNDDIPGIYKDARVLVFASVFEGFGAPVLEGLFSKVPVIESKGGAIEEAAGPGSVLVNPENTAELADALLRVLNDEQLRRRMIDTGYQHAQSMTDTVFAAKVMAVYKQVLKQR